MLIRSSNRSSNFFRCYETVRKHGLLGSLIVLKRSISEFSSSSSHSFLTLKILQNALDKALTKAISYLLSVRLIQFEYRLLFEYRKVFLWYTVVVYLSEFLPIKVIEKGNLSFFSYCVGNLMLGCCSFR